MNNKYFDRWEFQQAFSLMETNPVEANLKFEEYLKKYPKDYAIYSYYVSNLITIGELDKAEKVLNYMEKSSKTDKQFNSQINKVKRLEENIVFSKLRLMACQEKYEEILGFCQMYPQEIKKLELGGFMLFCKKKTGRLKNATREGNSYIFRQIIDYKESDFLEHIQKHLADYNANLDEPNKYVFASNFPIKQVIEEIKKYIPSDKKLCVGPIENIYIFKYDGCGRDNNKIVNYFKVVCFNNTTDFITICPSAGCENLPCVDLNYLIDNIAQTNKTTRVSQIDKFNLRFRRK